LRQEGLLLGGSAALNVAAAARIAMKLPAKSTAVTVLCDGGGRYLSRLYNAQWLAENGLVPSQRGLTFL
jgi:cysteine synthase